ncbi:EF-hand domain-containing protein [Marivita sp.]|uniref:EF-hand domain-containing protein n=1 Tax=Marivita sp. TaxID=2003365 RepID=UPI0025C3E992|nr:EF-hand domain-containing protein [Marivita sp.]
MTLNKKVMALVVAAMSVTGAATVVLAQDRMDRGERPAEMFSRLDTDGDGQITAEELDSVGRGHMQDRGSRKIARLDSDGDGAVSEDEFAARRGEGAMFDRLDTNADGMISEEEFAEMRKGHMSGMKGGMRHGHR